MPHMRTTLHQSVGDDLRPVYRALGLSEETIARAIQYSKIGPDERPAPEVERRRGRPRQNARLLDQAASKPKPSPGHNRRSRRNILLKEGTGKRGAG
jgi:hypothetical protein